jgi:hypothetical protein
MNKFLYRVEEKGFDIIVYEIPIQKETEKLYVVARCKGSFYNTRIEKNYNKEFHPTKIGAIVYYITSKFENQETLSGRIKVNEILIKKAESLLQDETK